MSANGTAAGGRGMYIAAAAIVVVAPLAAAAIRWSMPAGTTEPIQPVEPGNGAQPLSRVELEIESSTPGARVTLLGETHTLPWSGEVAGSTTPVEVTVTAPGHQGLIFKFSLDRPRRIRFDLQPGSGVMSATPEETDDALNPDEIESDDVLLDAGIDAAARRAEKKERRLLAHARAALATAPSSPSTPHTEPVPPPTTAPTAVATAAPPATATAPPATVAPTVASPPPPATAEIKPGTVDVKGVRATVRAHGGEVQACYDRARLEVRDLQGRISIEAAVNPVGQVTSARLTGSTVASHRLEGCLLEAFRTWTFPQPAGGVPGVLSYNFVFKD